MTHGVEAFVLGRIGADLYPLQLQTPLEEVRTFERVVGGFAGNVPAGLARLGVGVAILSPVGDDRHGRFVRNFLANEGVDVRWLLVHPKLRTALAFCEAWPPDQFPITFYRTPTCPDWELRPEDLDSRGTKSNGSVPGRSSPRGTRRYCPGAVTQSYRWTPTHDQYACHALQRQ